MLTLTQRIVQTPAGPIRELIAQRPFTARLMDGRFRLGDAEGSSLAGLLEAAGSTAEALTVESARCAERFDRAADHVESAPADALVIARDGAVELAEIAPFMVGCGARPRIDAVDFDGVARLIRVGETAMALGLAQESIARLSMQLGRAVQEPTQQRPRQVFDDWFGADAKRVSAAMTVTAGTTRDSMRLGGLKNVRLGVPVVGGTGCANTFGSMSQWRCACGRLRADCGRCSLHTLASRDTTFVRFELGAPCLHPSHIEQIMGTLNLDATTVRSALDGSGRPSGDEDDDPLGRMIDGVRVKAPELLVTWVPIVPPGDRASNARPGDAGAWTLFEHPIENRLRRLISAADRMRELAEMAAPSGILVYVRAAQQVALFAYVEAVRSADSRSNEPNKARRLYVEAPHNFGTDVPVVLYLPDGGLLVQWSRIENHFDWTGRLRKQLNAHHCVPRYSIEDRLACIGASPGLHDIAVRTIDGVWLAEWPANMPCAFVGEAPFGGRRLVLPRLGHCEGGWSDDRPAVVAWTPDGAWIWIGEDSAVGDVVSTTCAARFALPLGADAREVLLFNGACRPLLDDDYASGPAAIVHAADRWHILQPDGVYSVGGTGQVRLGFDWLAAGFSHDATRLAVMVDGGVVLVLDTDTLQIVQRLNT